MKNAQCSGARRKAQSVTRPTGNGINSALLSEARRAKSEGQGTEGRGRGAERGQLTTGLRDRRRIGNHLPAPSLRQAGGTHGFFRSCVAEKKGLLRKTCVGFSANKF